MKGTFSSPTAPPTPGDLQLYRHTRLERLGSGRRQGLPPPPNHYRRWRAIATIPYMENLATPSTTEAPHKTHMREQAACSCQGTPHGHQPHPP